MIRKTIVVVLICFFIISKGYTQEFLGNIQIQHQGVDGIDPSVFSNMETTIFEFMNNKVWSNYNFKIEERIEFTMVITINEVQGSDIFKGRDRKSVV